MGEVDRVHSRYAGQTQHASGALGYSRVVFISQVATRKQAATDCDAKSSRVNVINNVIGADAA